MADNQNYSKQIFFVLFFIGLIAAVFVLKALSAIVLPVVFAVIFGFIFQPLVSKLSSKLRLPWGLSSVLITVLALLIFLALSSILITSLTSILGNYSRYENRFHQIYGKFENLLDLNFDDGKTFFENIWGFQQIRSLIQKIALSLSSGLFTSGKSILMVFLLMAFFLLEMNNLKFKTEKAFSNQGSQVYKVGIKISSEVTHFLSIKFYVSLATGFIVFLGTFLLRMDFPIVWGFLAFCMNFIPVFGSIISSLTTILFSVIQFYPSMWQTIIVIILMVSINMIIGNIIEPKIEGTNLGLSAFVILISLSLWGYIWGFLGMLLAVPMTVMIKIICENIEFLKPVAIILGNTGQVAKDKLKVKKEETED